ncbi:MAG: hypothetical protein ABIA04_12785 [Pseudomonadota bacterium]
MGTVYLKKHLRIILLLFSINLLFFFSTYCQVPDEAEPEAAEEFVIPVSIPDRISSHEGFPIMPSIQADIEDIMSRELRTYHVHYGAYNKIAVLLQLMEEYGPNWPLIRDYIWEILDKEKLCTYAYDRLELAYEKLHENSLEFISSMFSDSITSEAHYYIVRFLLLEALFTHHPHFNVNSLQEYDLAVNLIKMALVPTTDPNSVELIFPNPGLYQFSNYNWSAENIVKYYHSKIPGGVLTREMLPPTISDEDVDFLKSLMGISNGTSDPNDNILTDIEASSAHTKASYRQIQVEESIRDLVKDYDDVTARYRPPNYYENLGLLLLYAVNRDAISVDPMLRDFIFGSETQAGVKIKVTVQKGLKIANYLEDSEGRVSIKDIFGSDHYIELLGNETSPVKLVLEKDYKQGWCLKFISDLSGPGIMTLNNMMKAMTISDKFFEIDRIMDAFMIFGKINLAQTRVVEIGETLARLKSYLSALKESHQFQSIAHNSKILKATKTLASQTSELNASTESIAKWTVSEQRILSAVFAGEEMTSLKNAVQNKYGRPMTMVETELKGLNTMFASEGSTSSLQAIDRTLDKIARVQDKISKVNFEDVYKSTEYGKLNYLVHKSLRTILWPFRKLFDGSKWFLNLVGDTLPKDKGVSSFARLGTRLANSSAEIRLKGSEAYRDFFKWYKNSPKANWIRQIFSINTMSLLWGLDVISNLTTYHLASKYLERDEKQLLYNQTMGNIANSTIMLGGFVSLELFALNAAQTAAVADRYGMLSRLLYMPINYFKRPKGFHPIAIAAFLASFGIEAVHHFNPNAIGTPGDYIVKLALLPNDLLLLVLSGKTSKRIIAEEIKAGCGISKNDIEDIYFTSISLAKKAQTYEETWDSYAYLADQIQMKYSLPRLLYFYNVTARENNFPNSIFKDDVAYFFKELRLFDQYIWQAEYTVDSNFNVNCPEFEDDILNLMEERLNLNPGYFGEGILKPTTRNQKFSIPVLWQALKPSECYIRSKLENYWKICQQDPWHEDCIKMALPE